MLSLFQFVNSFNSLFYMAFIKRSVEGCVDKNTKAGVDPYCGAELRNQITIIFVIAVLKNFTEVGATLILSLDRSSACSELAERA